MKPQTQERIHPLQDKPAYGTPDWAGWMTQFDKAETHVHLQGLLLTGFGAPLNGARESDRVKFYLDVADAWCSFGFFKKPDASEDRSRDVVIGTSSKQNLATYDEAHRSLACTAFDMLCTNYFKRERQRIGMYDKLKLAQSHQWLKELMQEGLLDRIVEFFGIEKSAMSSSIRIRNLGTDVASSPSRSESEATDFLRYMIAAIWAWEEKVLDVPHDSDALLELNERMRTQIDRLKPWSVQILSVLDQLRSSHFEKLLPGRLDTASVQALEKIALSKTEEFPDGHRRPRTLLEARVKGADEAWILFMHEEALEFAAGFVRAS